MAVARNVAVIGASGNLGSPVLKALLQAHFNVTVLTRSQKPGIYGDNVTVIEVDFDSVGSLTSALQGQDAVVSTVGKAGLEGQKIVIDAAIAAGVHRFIPSDFGVCTTSPKVSELPVYSTFATIRQYLADKAAAGAISYTVLACGSFLEYFLGTPSVIDFKSHSVALIDGGNNRVSSTTMANIGRAVAGIFKNLDKTENRVVYVSEAILTQKQLLDIAKEVKPEIEWTVSSIKSSQILKEGLDAAASGDDSWKVAERILVGTTLGGEEYGTAYDDNDNALFGIETISQEKLRGLIAERLN